MRCALDARKLWVFGCFPWGLGFPMLEYFSLFRCLEAGLLDVWAIKMHLAASSDSHIARNVSTAELDSRR